MKTYNPMKLVLLTTLVVALLIGGYYLTNKTPIIPDAGSRDEALKQERESYS